MERITHTFYCYYHINLVQKNRLLAELFIEIRSIIFSHQSNELFVGEHPSTLCWTSWEIKAALPPHVLKLWRSLRTACGLWRRISWSLRCFSHSCIWVFRRFNRLEDPKTRFGTGSCFFRRLQSCELSVRLMLVVNSGGEAVRLSKSHYNVQGTDREPGDFGFTLVLSKVDAVPSLVAWFVSRVCSVIQYGVCEVPTLKGSAALSGTRGHLFTLST